jgi:peptidoglycan/LPS O-acetylase OafA/YrhL
VLFLLVGSYIAILTLRPFLNAPWLDQWLLKEPAHSPLWYLTFTQTYPMIEAGGYNGAGPRWMGITWSLAIEEQFYLLFPVVVYLMPPQRLKYLLIGLVLFAWLSRSGIHYYVGWYEAYISLPGRVDCLALGVLVAILVRDQRALNLARKWRLALDGVILALAYAVATSQFHWWSALLQVYPLVSTGCLSLVYSAIAVMFALCILRIFLYPGTWYSHALTWRPLAFIGLISYGLYMYHQAINGLAHGLLFGGEPKVGTWEQFAAAVFVMGLAVGIATASYVWIETPIRRQAQRVAYRPAAPALVPT